jgi:short-subunit dehydrogenase
LFNIGVNHRQGKWALVTGASSGIGLAFAEKLASLGMNLALTARRADRLAQIAARLAGLHNISVEVCRADLAEPGGPAAVHAFTEKKGIAVELLVNNAGVGGYGEFRTSDPGRQVDMVRLNCTAVVHLTHLYLPAMVARRGGEIVITASTAAFQPTPYIAVYGASKAFDLLFAEALAEEVARHGIRVCALCPGPTESEFHAVAGVPEEGHEGRMPAAPVVEAALRALDSGKHLVVPGAGNRWQIHLQRLAPRRFVSGAAERVLRPPHLRKK